MVYQVRNLIQDCSGGRGRLKLDKADKLHAYQSVWDTLCKWIEDQFTRGKGVSIPNFCRLGWQVSPSVTGAEKQTPFFELTDHFCRSHGLPVVKRPSSEQRSSCQDINFIKLAIKYSANLTKDMVFSGTRDLFQRIGRIVASGQKMKLDMKVGVLLARERKVHFHFDNNARESAVRASAHKSRTASRTKAPRSTGPARTLLEAPQAMQQSVTRITPVPETLAPVHAPGRVPDMMMMVSRRSSAAVGTGAGAGQVRGVPSLAVASKGRKVPGEAPAFADDEPDIGDVGYDDEEEGVAADGSLTAKMALGSATVSHDRQKQWGYLTAHHNPNPVLEEAFARHQQHLIELAEHKAQEHVQTEEAMWQQELEMRRKKRAAQEQKRELQQYIKMQIKEQQERRKAEREGWKSLAPAPLHRKYATLEDTKDPLAFSKSKNVAAEESGEHHNGAIIEGATMYDFIDGQTEEALRAREELKVGLLDQINRKHAEEEAAKHRSMDQERRYLEHVRLESEEQRLFQKMQHQIVKRDLMRAWDRDIQLKNTLKAKEMEGKRGRRGSATLTPMSSAPALGIGLGVSGMGSTAPPPLASKRGFAGSSRRIPTAGGYVQ